MSKNDLNSDCQIDDKNFRIWTSQVHIKVRTSTKKKDYKTNPSNYCEDEEVTKENWKFDPKQSRIERKDWLLWSENETGASCNESRNNARLVLFVTEKKFIGIDVSYS